MAEKQTPTRSSNMEKAEGDRNTVAETDTKRRSEWGEAHRKAAAL
jgi:hypothetical protein